MQAGPVQAVPPPPPVATESKQPIEEEASSKEDPTPSKPVVGIIYPPPEVRNIVDKTASFVARNGPEFEARIRQNEINNPKFNFLNPNDPYHAYYRHKVSEFKEGKAQEPSAAIPKVMQQQQQATQQQLPQKVQDQVSVIKVKIHEATGMPAGKQKLQYEGIFIKDSNSLAYYNMASGAVIHAPRINVVPMPPAAPPIMAPRPPPMIVPTAFVPAPGSVIAPMPPIIHLALKERGGRKK